MQLDWIPVFTSILDSSLWEEPPHVRLMFFTLMFMKDPADHVVREPMRRISKLANLSDNKEEAYRLAVEAVRILLEPDKRSLENQPYQGRRLLEVDGGLLVINGEYYEKRRMELGARIRKTQLQRARREHIKQAKERLKRGVHPTAGETSALKHGEILHELQSKENCDAERQGGAGRVGGNGEEARGMVHNGSGGISEHREGLSQPQGGQLGGDNQGSGKGYKEDGMAGVGTGTSQELEKPNPNGTVLGDIINQE